jgi:hypothetical protein
MIDINLIPQAFQKNGKNDANSLKINLPKEVLMGVGAGVVFLLVLVHLVLGGMWLIGIGHLSHVKSKWDSLSADKGMLDAMAHESVDLKKKMKTISDMTVKKSIMWSPKFNAISDALPRGLWMRQMTLDKVGLTMEGGVVSKSQSQINDVDQFLSALKQNDNFMKGFSSLEVNSIQGGKNTAIEVTDFSVMAKLIEVKSDVKNGPKSK